jgi:hypothetical protein
MSVWRAKRICRFWSAVAVSKFTSPADGLEEVGLGAASPTSTTTTAAGAGAGAATTATAEEVGLLAVEEATGADSFGTGRKGDGAPFEEAEVNVEETVKEEEGAEEEEEAAAAEEEEEEEEEAVEDEAELFNADGLMTVVVLFGRAPSGGEGAGLVSLDCVDNARCDSEEDNCEGGGTGDGASDGDGLAGPGDLDEDGTGELW